MSLVLAVGLGIAGCKTSPPNPVKGWTMWNPRLAFPDLQNYHTYPEALYYSPDKLHRVDKLIFDDFQKYIQDMKLKNPALWVSDIYFFEDDTGRHAVKLVMEVGPRIYVEYLLMYNNANVRTNVIKGQKWRQFHI